MSGPSAGIRWSGLARSPPRRLHSNPRQPSSLRQLPHPRHRQPRRPRQRRPPHPRQPIHLCRSLRRPRGPSPHPRQPPRRHQRQPAPLPQRRPLRRRPSSLPLPPLFLNPQEHRRASSSLVPRRRESCCCPPASWPGTCSAEEGPSTSRSRGAGLTSPSLQCRHAKMSQSG